MRDDDASRADASAERLAELADRALADRVAHEDRFVGARVRELAQPWLEFAGAGDGRDAVGDAALAPARVEDDEQARAPPERRRISPDRVRGFGDARQLVLPGSHPIDHGVNVVLLALVERRHGELHGI